MINASTYEKLRALNCSAMADEFQNQINDSKSYNLLGFEERLGLLVDAEWNRRQANKLKNLIKLLSLSQQHVLKISNTFLIVRLIKHRCFGSRPANTLMRAPYHLKGSHWFRQNIHRMRLG